MSHLNRQSNLLWVDGLAGAVVGTVMLVLSGWLSLWYHLPRDLMVFMGGVNLAYAFYSLTLASRPRRPMAFIHLLVFANGAWAVACVRWAVVHWEQASPLGLVHLLGEAAVVGGLACLEWRWRASLTTRQQ